MNELKREYQMIMWCELDTIQFKIYQLENLMRDLDKSILNKLLLEVLPRSVEELVLFQKNGANLSYEGDLLLVKYCSSRQYQQTGVIEFLLKQGIDPNTHYGDPLICAAASNSTETVKILLEYGAIITDVAIQEAIKHTHFQAIELFNQEGNYQVYIAIQMHEINYRDYASVLIDYE